MLDNFLQELFGPGPGSTFDPLSGRVGLPIGMDAGPSFNDRFSPTADMPQIDPELERTLLGRSLEGLNAPTPPDTPTPVGSGMVEPSLFPGGTQELSARSAVPMPRARPDIDSILSGDTAKAVQSFAPSQPAPVSAGVPPAAPSLLDVLSGRGGRMPFGGGGGESDPSGGLFGKRVMSALANGLSGGNPAFKAGAFMQGMGKGLAGSLKSDKEDAEAAAKADEMDFKREKFGAETGLKERQVANSEKTGDALRKLYGDRGEAIRTGKANTAWNKPASERFKEAQQLIIAKNKEIDAAMGADNPLMPKADREARRAAAQQAKDAFKSETYRNMGLNPDGSGVSGSGTPSSRRVMGDKEAQDSGVYGKPDEMLGTGTQDDPYIPQTQEHFDALPAGALFLNPKTGTVMRKRATGNS
jgi:hypothetical protein